MTVRLLDVLADQPFAEIGRPLHVLDDPAHSVVVAAGTLGHLQWFGYGVGGARERVGVYDRGDLTCLQLAAPRWPVNDVAIHPSGRWVAVAAGRYDGGYAFEGELLVLDLHRGTSTSVLDDRRQVCAVRWLDDARLSVELSPHHDDFAAWEDLVGESFEIEASWGEVTERSIDLSGTRGRQVPFTYPRSDSDAAGAALESAAARAGSSWALRRQVWSVAGREDGSVLAACEGVAAERWAPEGGAAPAWRRIATAGTGCQLAPLNGTTVLTTVETRAPAGDREAPRRLSEHDVIAVATGDVLASVRPDVASVGVVASGRLGLLRPASNGEGRGTPGSMVIDSDGATVARLGVSSYDLFNHWFDITGAPAPLILAGDEPHPHRDKWVARVDVTPDGPTTRRLFPLEWDSTRAEHLVGGPGAFVDDDHGPAVVHSVEVTAPRGPAGAFLVRRAYPHGTVRWTAELPGKATSADAADGVVAVTTVNGWLMLLDARTGDPVHAAELQVHDLPVVPLSVSAYGDGRLAVGLLDGRVMRLQQT